MRSVAMNKLEAPSRFSRGLPALQRTAAEVLRPARSLAPCRRLRSEDAMERTPPPGAPPKAHPPGARRLLSSLPCRSEMRVERGRVCKEFGARRGMGDGAAIEHDRVIGEGQDLLRLLLDDNHRQARPAEFAQRGQQFIDDDWRQSL